MWAPTQEPWTLFRLHMSTDPLEYVRKTVGARQHLSKFSWSTFGRQLELDSTCRSSAGVRSEGGWCSENADVDQCPVPLNTDNNLNRFQRAVCMPCF